MFLRLLITLFFLIGVLIANEYPKTFAKLGTPLFESSKKLSAFIDIETLTPEIQKYQNRVVLAKENGKRVDTYQDKQEIKAYLLELRKLQKNYDFLLHLIHKEIVLSIDKNEYNRFIKLTSIELQGLLQNKNIFNKSIEFYKQNRGQKRCDFLENRIEKEALFEATSQEFYNEIVESSFSSQDAKKRSKKSVSIYTKRVKNQIDIYFLNSNIYDVTVSVKPYYQNIKESPNTAKEFVIKAKSSILYTRLNLMKSHSSYGYSYSWIMGNKDAVHDDRYLYRFPYAVGSAYQISQGYNGVYTHKGSSQYALDFAMKEGTKVYAARSGVVVKTKSDSNIGGYDKKFAKDGNYVTIAHSDGTFATYYHLKQGGVTVRVGDMVRKGTHIGYSGNTGYSSGPHLHFAVFTALSARKTQTISVKFQGVNGVITPPLQGEFYQAK